MVRQRPGQEDVRLVARLDAVKSSKSYNGAQNSMLVPNSGSSLDLLLSPFILGFKVIELIGTSLT